MLWVGVVLECLWAGVKGEGKYSTGSNQYEPTLTFKRFPNFDICHFWQILELKSKLDLGQINLYGNQQ